MKVVFEQVKYIHKAKDSNGKYKRKTFSQTINPWNRNNKGKQKTRSEIFTELQDEAFKWGELLKTTRI